LWTTVKVRLKPDATYDGDEEDVVSGFGRTVAVSGFSWTAVVSGLSRTVAVSFQLMICERCNGVSPRRSGDTTSARAISVTRAISDPGAGTTDPAGCSGTTPSRMRTDPLLASYISLSPF